MIKNITLVITLSSLLFQNCSEAGHKEGSSIINRDTKSMSVKEYLRSHKREELSEFEIIPLVSFRNADTNLLKIEVQLLENDHYLFNKDLVDSTQMEYLFGKEYISTRDSIIVYIVVADSNNADLSQYFKLFAILKNNKFTRVCFGSSPPKPKPEPIIDKFQ